MDLEVVGRHALLFDDDSAAAFVNSGDALVEWNSLLIDRYDVRHLLSGPPPPRRRRNPQETSHSTPSPPSGSSLESELDYERFLDLPSPSDEQGRISSLRQLHLPEAKLDNGAKPIDGSGFHAVGFSYGNNEDSSDQNNADAGLGDSGFRPPFPVPESLLQCLPPTEKLHQIIARTAEFVSKHGGQTEIVLRVKQGDNPTFGFLMPDHHLHTYFRFLVDHQELLLSDTVKKSQDQTVSVTGGSLSLLGSVYGSGEDEDAAADYTPPAARVSEEPPDDVSALGSHGSEKTISSANVNGKDRSPSKPPLTSSKQKSLALKKNPPISASKAGTSSSTRKEGDSLSLCSSSRNKAHGSALPTTSKLESSVLEPPSDLKRVIDKIVEFILKNGKQFEAVLIEQDSKHGRFPFLLPSNLYHSYYQKVLQKAQESKLTGKSFLSEDVSPGNIAEKRTSRSKSVELASDLPDDSDRKGKFKMVIGKSKKDGQDPPPKDTQQKNGVGIDASAAAAILQAASRGIKNPNLAMLSNISQKGKGDISSQSERVDQKMEAEADSSESHLTREQKLKTERLKRAKLFVSMFKTGSVGPKPKSSRSVSVEPQESVLSVSVAEVGKIGDKEKEGSSVPLDVDMSDNNEKLGKKGSDDESSQRRPLRKYRSRRDEEDDEEDGHEKDHKLKKHRSRRSSYEEHGKEYEDEVERDHKHSEKKQRSYRSSHKEEKEEDERDHKRSRKKHRSSCEDGEDDEEESDHEDSRKKHQSSRSSRKEERREEEYGDHKHSRKKHRTSCDDEEERVHEDSRKKCRSHHYSREELEEEEDEEESDEKNTRNKRKSRNSSRHSRDRRKHKKRRSSEERESRRRRKHDKSSDDEDHNRRSSYKSRKRDHHSEREELEEGEISPKISDQSRGSLGGDGAIREASLDLPNLNHDGRAPSQPSVAAEVSDDLRAKIRAMLMSTM